MLAIVRRGFRGYPLVTAQAVHERLTKPLTGRIASVLARDTVDTIGRCWAGLHRLLEGFSRGERGDRFRRNRDRVTRAWVASFPRLAVTESEAAKATQFHFVPCLQRVHNPLQALREHRLNLVLRELHGGCHMIDEFCLCHTHLSSV
jgi:Ser/Thr protein kinase RdoA (MazF antagonist)